jgi:hypothetical protein
LQWLPLTTAALDSRGLAVGDVDGDGRLDIAISNARRTCCTAAWRSSC